MAEGVAGGSGLVENLLSFFGFIFFVICLPLIVCLQITLVFLPTLLPLKWTMYTACFLEVLMIIPAVYIGAMCYVDNRFPSDAAFCLGLIAVSLWNLETIRRRASRELEDN